jgi:hypothetical protein
MHILDIVHVFDIIEKITLAYRSIKDSENGVLSLLPIDGALGQAPQRNFSLPT